MILMGDVSGEEDAFEESSSCRNYATGETIYAIAKIGYATAETGSDTSRTCPSDKCRWP